MTRLLKYAAIIITAAVVASCNRLGAPSEAGLRDSFAQQLAANKFIKDFQRNGDEMTFSGPGAEGGVAKWRVHIDSVKIEPTEEGHDAQPYKGSVKSSWYSDNQLVSIRGKESNLPLELTSNGLAQECYALWDKAEKKWGW